MPFANTHIIKGTKTLYDWHIYLIPHEMTLRDFFEKLVYGETLSGFLFDLNIFEKVKHVKISQTLTSTAIQASQNCNIIELIHQHGEEWKSKEYANSQEKGFIESLTETIWYIDMSDPESYKKAQKLFNAQELNIHCQDLASYITFL
ncbi:21825_t:CDS:2 [Gigaspora margarita]|uniref:21825_t:CDS:1 n=1 Tax=Gigaspora margarita TaxID=4874 RepID=A0ABN7WDA5_GIGMA|nr:21825_t:CDS:2 [Gigaspora margarita]